MFLGYFGWFFWDITCSVPGPYPVRTCSKCIDTEQSGSRYCLSMSTVTTKGNSVTTGRNSVSTYGYASSHLWLRTFPLAETGVSISGNGCSQALEISVSAYGNCRSRMNFLQPMKGFNAYAAKPISSLTRTARDTSIIRL